MDARIRHLIEVADKNPPEEVVPLIVTDLRVYCTYMMGLLSGLKLLPPEEFAKMDFVEILDFLERQVWSISYLVTEVIEGKVVPKLISDTSKSSSES